MIRVAKREEESVTNDPLPFPLKVEHRISIIMRGFHKASGPHIVFGALKELFQTPFQNT